MSLIRSVNATILKIFNDSPRFTGEHFPQASFWDDVIDRGSSDSQMPYRNLFFFKGLNMKTNHLQLSPISWEYPFKPAYQISRKSCLKKKRRSKVVDSKILTLAHARKGNRTCFFVFKRSHPEPTQYIPRPFRISWKLAGSLQTPSST